MSGAAKFKQSDVAKQPGEIARVKVVAGPDQGVVFVITGSRVTVGRGDENEIVLSDLRASRKHLEIVISKVGTWAVNDLGSANGIAWNGKPVRNAPLRSKDTIGLGDTVLEFVSADAGTAVLQAPPTSPEQIQKEQMGLAVQKAKIQAMSAFGGLAKNVPRVAQDLKAVGGTRVLQQFQTLGQAAGSGDAKSGLDLRKLLIPVVAIGALLVLFGGSQTPAPKKDAVTDKKEGDGASRGLAAYLPTAESPQIERTAEMFYKNGFREYRVGNWVRARTQFETVLQMAPTHPLARLYLENCKIEIEREVKEHLGQGTKSLQAGKLKDARGHFEAVLRLLHREPASPSYKQAKEALTKVINEMANPEGEG